MLALTLSTSASMSMHLKLPSPRTQPADKPRSNLEPGGWIEQVEAGKSIYPKYRPIS